MSVPGSASASAPVFAQGSEVAIGPDGAARSPTQRAPQIGPSVDSSRVKDRLRHNDRLSWRLRTVGGVSFVVLGAIFLLINLSEYGPSTVIAALAGVSSLVVVPLCLEVVHLIRSRGYRNSPLALFPVAAIVPVLLAVWAQILCTGGTSSGWLVSQAPLLFGTYLVLRGLALRAEERVRERSVPFAMIASPECGMVVEKGQSLAMRERGGVAADAIIQSGSCSVLESGLSSSAAFRIKDEGDIVLAGSRILTGSAEAISLSSSDDSVASKIEKLIAPHIKECQSVLVSQNAGWVSTFSLCISFMAVAAAISWDKHSGDAVQVLLAGGLTLFIGSIGILIELSHSSVAAVVWRWMKAGFVSTLPATLVRLKGITDVLVDPSCVDHSSVCEARELELLDDRIGRSELCSCVASLLGRCDDPSLSAAGDLCQRTVGEAIASERVVDLREYDGRGVCGSIKGVEISIGTEDFIVERGIMLQPSDVVTPPPDERALLVAIDNEVIARFWVRYGQAALLGRSVVGLSWPEGLKVSMSTGAQGELTPNTLLVKGEESEVLGRSHALEVVRFAGERFELPSAVLIALTPSLRDLPTILHDLQVVSRGMLRLKALVAIAGVVSLAAVFSGVLSAVVPIFVLAVVALCCVPFRVA